MAAFSQILNEKAYEKQLSFLRSIEVIQVKADALLAEKSAISFEMAERDRDIDEALEDDARQRIAGLS
ncbi:hypothetical protein [Legionella clemsonensis]|uniref:Uncharacterized protein n=1 Tax=Legionella clemsonensis TaxID=1867846 RepID=A0A222P2X2_9GAMM|nr:hypothetical protein [Legionella clemsonensis]ASQ46189.1 hypothetical protein clem_08185 [Legionella clemsonensis]